MTERPSVSAGRRRRIAAVGAIAAAVVAADQVTTSLAVADLSSHDVHVIGPFWLRLTYNTGVAFSVGRGLTGPIIIVAVALVLAVAWLARGVPTMPVAAALGLVIGGAVGNLSDRLFRGHSGAVVDFLYTRFWPTFNLADASIVIGCALLAVAFARSGHTPLQGTSSLGGRSMSPNVDPPSVPGPDQVADLDSRGPGHRDQDSRGPGHRGPDSGGPDSGGPDSGGPDSGGPDSGGPE